MSTTNEPIITNVYLFDNGMVAVFDQFGQQMPDYQDPHPDAHTAIVRDAPPTARFNQGTLTREQFAQRWKYVRPLPLPDAEAQRWAEEHTTPEGFPDFSRFDNRVQDKQGRTACDRAMDAYYDALDRMR